MFASIRTLVIATAAASLLAGAPAIALPLAPQTSVGAIVTVSSWATRAEGRRHTYPDTDGYGYGYGQQGYGGYGWGYGGYAEPYDGYGRVGVPAYDDDEDPYDY